MSGGKGAVAFNSQAYITEFQKFITCFFDKSFNIANRQLTSFYATHLCGALLGNIELEVCRDTDFSNLWYVQNLPNPHRPSLDIAGEKLAQVVNHEVEVNVPMSCRKRSSEQLTLPGDIKRTDIADGTKKINLFHHELLDNKLIDNLFLDSTTRSHLVHIEVNVQLVFVAQIREVSLCMDGKSLIVSEDKDIRKLHAVGITLHACPQIQRQGEVGKHRGKGT